MPLGVGANDANRVYQVGESDATGPLFSDFENLGPKSISPLVGIGGYYWANAAARAAQAGMRDGDEGYQADTAVLYKRRGGAWKPQQTNIQLDATNSLISDTVQRGIARLTGAAAAFLTKSIVFPVAFTSGSPIVMATSGGSHPTGAFNPLGTSVGTANMANISNVSLTGFDLTLRNTGGNFAAGTEYYAFWEAAGIV